MKRTLISFLLVAVLLMVNTSAIAEIDYSGMTLDELLAAQEQLTAAIEAAQQPSENQETQEDIASSLDTSDYTEMSKGAKGDEVKTLQTRLFDLGFYTIAIDGDYGNGTVYTGDGSAVSVPSVPFYTLGTVLLCLSPVSLFMLTVPHRPDCHVAPNRNRARTALLAHRARDRSSQ